MLRLIEAAPVLRMLLCGYLDPLLCLNRLTELEPVLAAGSLAVDC